MSGTWGVPSDMEGIRKRLIKAYTLSQQMKDQTDMVTLVQAVEKANVE